MRSWGARRPGGLAIPWTGVAGSWWTFRAEADAHQVTCVAQHMPDGRADRGGIAPVAPRPLHTVASPGQCEHFSRLATDEGASPDCSEKHEQVGSQMSKLLGAHFVHSPASTDLVIAESAFRILLRTPGAHPDHLCSHKAGAKAALANPTEREWYGAWLPSVHREHPNHIRAPVPRFSQRHALFSWPERSHRARLLGCDRFTQRRSHGDALLEARRRQDTLDLLFAPLPRACFIGEAEEQGSSTLLMIALKHSSFGIRGCPCSASGSETGDSGHCRSKKQSEERNLLLKLRDAMPTSTTDPPRNWSLVWQTWMKSVYWREIETNLTFPHS